LDTVTTYVITLFYDQTSSFLWHQPSQCWSMECYWWIQGQTWELYSVVSLDK
jgi:hypothetical protein